MKSKRESARFGRACVCWGAAADGKIGAMKNTTIVLTFILGIGMAIPCRSVEAQGTTSGTPAKTPAQGTTGSGATSGTKQGTSAGRGTTTKTQSSTGAASTRVTVLKDDNEKSSYALGMNMGGDFRVNSSDLAMNAFIQGFKDGFGGGKTLLTVEEMGAVLTKMKAEMVAKQQEAMKIVGETNQKEGAAFLAANKTKDGVVTLASGLQYKILVEGKGPKPTASDTVVCNYRGTLINGTEFDSSYKTGKPAMFPVNRVIKGWTEALQLMPVGSKWQLFIPAALAYGERARSAEITPYSTLIFEVELVSINPKQ
jgi:FKBP-type peptidyl-prolyl cis-trans isomerase